MSKWKNLQDYDASSLGLVSTHRFTSNPNVPDGVSVDHALRLCGINEYLDHYASAVYPTGWFNESKSGYSLPNNSFKAMQELTKNNSRKEIATLFQFKDSYLVTKKKVFSEFVFGVRNEYRIMDLFEDKKLPKFLIDAHEQAVGYVDQEEHLVYPVVMWHPKNRDGTRPRYDDGFAIFTNGDMQDFLQNPKYKRGA